MDWLFVVSKQGQKSPAENTHTLGEAQVYVSITYMCALQISSDLLLGWTLLAFTHCSGIIFFQVSIKYDVIRVIMLYSLSQVRSLEYPSTCPCVCVKQSVHNLLATQLSSIG